MRDTSGPRGGGSLAMPDGRPLRVRRRGPLAAIWLALVGFLALLAVLAARLAAGQDPGLLAMKARTPRPARQVLVKRIYERVVVVHLPANAAPHGSSSSQQVSSEGAAPAPGALVTRAS